MGRRKRELMSEGEKNIIAGLLQGYNIKTASETIEDIYGFEENGRIALLMKYILSCS